MTKAIINMSGGKDSTATALLAIEREVDAIFAFADTGHEHAQTYEYIEYLQDVLGMPPDPSLLLPDGLHPSLAGQTAIVRAVVETLTDTT